MVKQLVIGLDIGTTSVKAVVFNVTGTLVADAEKMITTKYPHPGRAEQDPREIECSCVLVMKEVIEKANIQTGELLTVGISCAMHSLICVDENGEPLSQMIIWSDGRSSKQAEKLKQTSGKDIYEKTGTPIHPMTPLVKLMWMKETGYEAYQKATYFMSMKELLLFQWFGKRVIDYSMASATGMFNLQTYDWDEQALNLAGVKKDQLSEIVPPTKMFVDIKENYALEMGISTQVPFVIGAADGQLANIGSGSISPGEVAVSVGTSGAIRQFTNGAPINRKQETFTYAFTTGTSIIGGPTNNGGIALQWLKDLLAFQGSHDELLAGAGNVNPGANGMIFLPYVNGERAPLWNQHARGNFFGLHMGHHREHLVRAVLEGITFNIYQIGKSLEGLAGASKKISVNGGLTRSLLWVQIMADVFGKDMHISATHHNAAWGAAWTALVGIKAVTGFEEIRENMPAEKVIQMNPQHHERYSKIYEKYEMIAKDLAVYFTE